MFVCSVTLMWLCRPVTGLQKQCAGLFKAVMGCVVSLVVGCRRSGAILTMLKNMISVELPVLLMLSVYVGIITM